METLVTVLHYIVCIIMIGVILMQAGKGADMGAAFGAGGSQTVFGARGPATFLNKLTIGAALIFLVTSLMLVQMAKKDAVSSVVDSAPATAPQQAAPEVQTSPVVAPEAAAPAPQADPVEKK